LIALDTSAIVAILVDEPDAHSYANIVSLNTCLISTGTLVECHQVLGGRLGAAGVALVDDFLADNAIRPIAVDRDHVDAAAIARLTYGRGTGHPARLNFGDCFSYALAKTRAIPLLFKGDDFIHTDVISAMPQAAP
jgi:ribonuclease VapC